MLSKTSQKRFWWEMISELSICTTSRRSGIIVNSKTMDMIELKISLTTGRFKKECSPATMPRSPINSLRHKTSTKALKIGRKRTLSLISLKSSFEMAV